MNLATLQRNRAVRREHRQERKELVRQLDAYKTPQERAELEAMIGRADGDISEVESILTTQRYRSLS